MMKRVVQKLTSARFLIVLMLTIILSVMAVRGQVSAEVFVAIYSPIIAFYFTRRDRGDK